MTTSSGPVWLLSPEGKPKDFSAIPSGVEYHRVLAGNHRRIGRGILAIVLLLAGLVFFSLAANWLSAVIDTGLGNSPSDYTPARHAGSMIGLALLIPWSMLIQRRLYGKPAASLHSVSSRFRFDLLGKSLLVFGPAWLFVNAIGFLGPVEEVPWAHTDLIAMFIITFLLTPLQAAGEEYGFRGLVFRILGSWTHSRRLGLIIGIVVTSAAFTAMHGSTDPYIITWYLTLFSCLSIITWRTGGLEIAIVLHAVLNTLSFLAAFYLRIDFGAAIGDRSAGVGTPYQLLPAFVIAVITAIIWWWTRKSGPARTPSDQLPRGDEG